MARLSIGVQLYTVRDQLNKDFIGTLRQVRAIGYTHVELAGFGPFSAVELRKVLTDVGLTPVSSHCVIDRLEREIQPAIDEAKSLGIRYLVCPWLPEERRKDEAGWRACAGVLNKAGRLCREQGITLCYHNHSFEFVRVGGRSALDLLYSETEPTFVQAELDTYWVKHGGDDPAAYIRKLSGRCPLLHLKDMADDAGRSFAEVGSGTLDFKAIFDAAVSARSEWGLVEQDVCPGDPLECIRTSLVNLRRLGFA